MKKVRLDQRLLELDLVKSKSRAQALIIAGKVLVNDVPVTKCGATVTIESTIRLKEADHPYVSRGGLKLEKALLEFKIDVEGKVALDVGASTGGFTDVLLSQGAKFVVAVDVGRNQLDWKLRTDDRVLSLEGVNARNLRKEDLPEHLASAIDVIVVDVSFISLKLILPALLSFFRESTRAVTLIKPQFEVGRENVGEGGIVRDDNARQRVIKEIEESALQIGLILKALIESPIKGSKGNVEYLAFWQKA